MQPGDFFFSMYAGTIRYSIVVFVFGLIVALMNSSIHRRLSSPASRSAGKRLSIAIIVAVVALFAIESVFTYLEITRWLRPWYGPGRLPRCDIIVSKYLSWIYERQGSYPEDMNELLAELKAKGITKNLLICPHENLLVCPHGSKNEISFEYFDPWNVKPGIEKFILLYEKPDIHLPGTERTIIFNNGRNRSFPEHQVYDLLVYQSISPDGFVWEESKFDGHCPKPRWRQKREGSIHRIAARVTVAVALVFAVAFFPGLLMARERRKA